MSQGVQHLLNFLHPTPYPPHPTPKSQLYQGFAINLVPFSPDSFPLWPIFGIGGLALILLLLLNGDSSSAQASVSSGNAPLSLTSTGECDLTPSGNGSDHTQIIEIPCNVTPKTPTEVKKVVEPSMIKALILLIVLLCIVRYKHRSLKIRNS